MKSTFLLLFLMSALLYFEAHAQRHEAGFKVSVPDSSNISTFEQNPDLHHLVIRYRNNNPSTISTYNHDSKGGKWMETLYMHFEGDCYILDKKYPSLSLPKSPKLDVWHFRNIERLRDSSVAFEVTTTIKKDTLIHNFDYFIAQKGTAVFKMSDLNSPVFSTYKFKDSVIGRDTAYTQHPRLKKDLSQFQTELTLRYSQWKPIAIVDSVLVITGIVERNGSFGNVQLMMGRQSAFSDKVMQFISQEAISWWPVLGNTRIVRQSTRIFVRLNQDDSITFSTL